MGNQASSEYNCILLWDLNMTQTHKHCPFTSWVLVAGGALIFVLAASMADGTH